MKIYNHPKSIPFSTDFKLTINGKAIEILATGVVDFAICALEPADFPAHVEVVVGRKIDEVTLRPLSKKLKAVVENETVRFTLERPEKISIDFGGSPKALYLYAQGPETKPPAVADASVVTFPVGQVTEAAELSLEDGQTLYLPGGAVLKGRIYVKGRKGIRICGHGIFDGSLYTQGKPDSGPSILLERCEDVLIEDITMVRPSGWMIVLGACANVTVRNVKEIGEVVTSDGIDVVGSRDVLIEDCFLHNNDDCVVVKAFFFGGRRKEGIRFDARENVENVLVRNCTFANWMCGNAMEIGYELAVDKVDGVFFQDIDVIHVHGSGAVFSIHNSDFAAISNVLFENIRIEHYDKLIDLRVLTSRYGTSEGRGSVKGVTFRDIYWSRTPFNAGSTISLIGGWDEKHPIEDVLIENFVIDGKPIQHLDELEICTRHCNNLRLKS